MYIEKFYDHASIIESLDREVLEAMSSIRLDVFGKTSSIEHEEIILDRPQEFEIPSLIGNKHLRTMKMVKIEDKVKGLQHTTSRNLTWVGRIKLTLTTILGGPIGKSIVYIVNVNMC